MALLYDAASGTYINPSTGAVSLDPLGTQAVTDPSLISQAKRNLAVSHGLLGQLAGYGQQFTQAVGGENELARHLSDVIAGRAPSVAGAQLQQGLGQVRQAADSEASGASGNNAALARIEAIQAGGAAGASANQTGAILRAEEVANAERNEGAVLGNVAGQSAQMYGTNLSGAVNFSGQAGNESAQQAQIDAAKDAANKQLVANIVAAAGATAATVATGGAAAPLAGAALAGLARGEAGHTAAANANPDITANLPSVAPTSATTSGATDEDLLAPTSSAPVPSAADTHALVNSLGPTYEGPDINPGTGLSTSQAYTSDRREKTDVSKAPMQDFLDKIAGFTFGYKAPGTPGEAPGQRISPMAQDVRRSAIGKTMVLDGKPLQMDIPNAVGGALAAVAYLNDEIKKLKGQR